MLYAHLLDLTSLPLRDHGQEHEGPSILLAIRDVGRVGHKLGEVFVGHHVTDGQAVARRDESHKRDRCNLKPWP